MKEIINVTMSTPASIFNKYTGHYLPFQIDLIAEDLKTEHGYNSVEFKNYEILGEKEENGEMIIMFRMFFEINK